MSRVVNLSCERKGCKSTSRLTIDKADTLVMGWVRVAHWEKIPNAHTGKETTEVVFKDICSADCAAKYFHAMAKGGEEK